MGRSHLVPPVLCRWWRNVERERGGEGCENIERERGEKLGILTWGGVSWGVYK